MEPISRIRAGIDALPATYEGREVVVLRDRLGITPDVIVSREAVAILACLDGSRTLRDIQIALMRTQNLSLVSMEEIRSLVDALDSRHLLDNDRFRKHRQMLTAAFREESVRAAAHAGTAYAADPDELNRQCAAYFEDIAGKKEPSAAASRGLRGLIVPHIDFHRGGACYARGYSTLKEAEDFDLFVILGTSHLPMELPFALTTKTFRTPLGDIPTDDRLATAVAEKSGMDLFCDELIHRAEHTIELQIVFLQHLFQPNRPIRILPILCGGFHDMILERVPPAAQPAYLHAMEALAAVLAGSPHRICIIASADLAHLGPQFGDQRSIQRGDLSNIERQDMELIQHLLHGDAQGFYRQIMDERDSRRICGLPPIYTLLKVLQPARVDLLHYTQAYDPNATVTFASLAVY